MKKVLRFTGSKGLLIGEEVFKQSAKKIGGIDMDMKYYGDYFYDRDGKFKNIYTYQELGEYDYVWIGGIKGIPFRNALIYYFGHLQKKKFIDGITLSTIDNSKLLQVVFLNYYNIPTPQSIFFMKTKEHIERHMHLVSERFTYPLVVKDPMVNKGKGVALLKNEGELETYLHNLDNGGCVLVQEFIQNDGDYRVITTKKGMILSVKRYNDHDFRNNISQGGVAYRVDNLPSQIAEISQKIADKYGLDIAGIDFFIQGEEYSVIEINKFPDYKIFEEVAGVSYTESVLEYIKTL